MSDVTKAGEEALKQLEQDVKEGKIGEEKEEEAEEKEVVVREEEKKVKSEAADPEPTPEEAAKIREARKALLANVLSRGILNDKLSSLIEAAVPRGRKGKFVRDDDGDIVRYKGLGYTFEYSEDVQSDILDANGHVRVGDVILMTVSVDDRELLREVKQDRVRKNLGKGRKEFMEAQQKQHEERGGPIPFDEGTTQILIGRGG